jgi:hypothetical protein
VRAVPGSHAYVVPNHSFTGYGIWSHTFFVIVFHREEVFDRGSRGQGLGSGFEIEFAEKVAEPLCPVMVVTSA